MAAVVSVENRMVVYVDRQIESAQLALNRIREVPVSGLVTGLPRAVIGGCQIVTAVAVSALRLTNLEGTEDSRLIGYITHDGIERTSRGCVNILFGAVETTQAVTLLLNPLALFYRIVEYGNRPNLR